MWSWAFAKSWNRGGEERASFVMDKVERVWRKEKLNSLRPGSISFSSIHSTISTLCLHLWRMCAMQPWNIQQWNSDQRFDAGPTSVCSAIQLLRVNLVFLLLSFCLFLPFGTCFSPHSILTPIHTNSVAGLFGRCGDTVSCERMGLNVDGANSKHENAHYVSLPVPRSDIGQNESILWCSENNTHLFPRLPSRRDCFTSFSMGTLATVAGAGHANELTASHLKPIQNEFQSPMPEPVPDPIVLPLEPSSGGTFCVRVTISSPEATTSSSKNENGSKFDVFSREDFRVYKAIVDTGSPYLVLPFLPDYPHLERTEESKFSRWINKYPALAFMNSAVSFVSQQLYANIESAPLMPLALPPSEYLPTEEIYGAVKGKINWKSAYFTFSDPRLSVSMGSKSRLGQTHSQPLDPMKTHLDEMERSPVETMGVLGELDFDLTNEATGGGKYEPFALLGLIQNSNPNADKSRFPDPRPTLLEQECILANDGNEIKNDFSNSYGVEAKGMDRNFQIQSFSVDGPNRELTLSAGALISNSTPGPTSFMPLVDLRPLGDFVDHYAVLVDSVLFDGVAVSSQLLKEFSGELVERPIVAVFDTGLTGCLMTRPFWNVMQDFVRSNRHENRDQYSKVNDGLFQSVVVNVEEVSTKSQEPKQKRKKSFSKIGSSLEREPYLFYVQPIDLDWYDSDQNAPYTIVLGQAFLRRGILTVNMNERIAAFE